MVITKTALAMIVCMFLSYIPVGVLGDSDVQSYTPVVAYTFNSPGELWEDWNKQTDGQGNIQFDYNRRGWMTLVGANKMGDARIVKEFGGFDGVRITVRFHMNDGRGFNGLEVTDSVHGITFRAANRTLSILSRGQRLNSVDLPFTLNDRDITLTLTVPQASQHLNVSISNPSVSSSLAFPTGYTGNLFAADFWLIFVSHRDAPDPTDLSVTIYSLAIEKQVAYSFAKADGFDFNAYPTQIRYLGRDITTIDAFWYAPLVWYYPNKVDNYVYTELGPSSIKETPPVSTFRMSSEATKNRWDGKRSEVFATDAVIDYRIDRDFFVMRVRSTITFKAPAGQPLYLSNSGSTLRDLMNSWSTGQGKRLQTVHIDMSAPECIPTRSP